MVRAEPPDLLTPGPTPSHPDAARILGAPLIYHESPTFRSEFRQALDDLAWLARTSNEPVISSSSITGACGGVFSNIVEPGSPILLVVNGNFANMWRSLAAASGASVAVLEVPWGQAADPQMIAAYLDRLPRVRLVAIVHCETSTGAVLDLEAIARICSARPDVLLVVDAATSVGAVPIEMDEWGVDVLISGSQKAFGVPPGLGITWFSERAAERAARMTNRRFDWDWNLLRDRQQQGCLYTPNIPLVRSLQRSVAAMRGLGHERLWARSEALAAATRAGVRALGLSLFSPDDPCSVPVTAINLPTDIDGLELRTELASRYGVRIAGGHLELASRLLRIGSIGWVEAEVLVRCMNGLSVLLAERGHEYPTVGEAGAAVRAALAATLPES